ncbi:EVE domain-containing protein [Spirochaeta dissipatitropha]
MYWLVKTEPSTFSILDLAAKPFQTEHWDGVRNYQARNFMRDDMKVNDLVLFYHSNCSPPGVVGVCRVVREGYPDFTALDSESNYFDPKASADNPRWYMVDVKLEEIFPGIVSLDEMKSNPALEGMRLLQKGNRLSVLPVEKHEFAEILSMANSDFSAGDM